MKTRLSSKPFYWSVFVIGFAGISATTSSVLAADVGMAVLKDSPIQRSAKPAAMSVENSVARSKGAQGPIRTESFDNQKSKADSEMLRRDLESQRYPMSSNAAIP